MDRKTTTRRPRHATRSLAALTALIGSALIAAAPASAGDEFSRGFENEMGRIVAHAAVGAGLGLLHAVAPPVVVHHQPAPVYVHYSGHRGHDYGHGHRHGPGCGHYRAHHYGHDEHAYKHYRKHYKHHARHRGYDDHDDVRYRRGIPRHEYEQRVIIERRGGHARYRH